MISRPFLASASPERRSEPNPSAGARTAPVAGYPRWLKDIAIRCGGLMLIFVAVLAFSWLYRLVHAVPHSEATLGQYGIAVIGFLSASLGLGLAALGYSIHDPVEVSERWRPRL